MWCNWKRETIRNAKRNQTLVVRERAPRLARGSRCKQLLLGVWGRSSNGALLLLAEGVPPLLRNHNRRVRFPTTLCTLSRGRRLSIVERAMVSTNQCAPPPPPNPNSLLLSGFCIGRYSKWSWNGVSSFLLQVSLFLYFKRIIPALRRAGVALIGHGQVMQGWEWYRICCAPPTSSRMALGGQPPYLTRVRRGVGFVVHPLHPTRGRYGLCANSYTRGRGVGFGMHPLRLLGCL